MKYQELLINWLENYVKPTSKERTYSNYSNIVRLHLIPRIGKYKLCDLTPLIIIQGHITELLSSGNIKNGMALSSNSVNSIITVIQRSLKVL